ncbi:hypothetical protein BXZ70DRAFT_282113 [Cristinia sonorae]|uniref:Uncharacterized protein n=1 Tax=Cristinia sonorae TaxID=1940300 RepID=A0A8K0V0N3_9AGAR|nr:hypothetical protein BXZ70DRAFT_282113 [Cristinia sonorae]
MVRLSLAPTRGNNSSRYFPFQGYLGLTPLRVEGVVRTKLEEDGKPLHAKSLAVHVRCYESRVTRTGSHRSRILVDYSKTLWQKQDSDPFGYLGDFDATFRITLPANVSGFSTANYQEYKTFWRVEAVLEHVPITAIGSRLLRYYDLPLVRYDVPPHSNPSPTTSDPPSTTPHTLYVPNSKPPTPIIHYNLSTPVLPVGPSDLILTSIFLRPLDASVSIRSASVLIERRIDLYQSNSSAFTSATDVAPTSDENDSPVASTSSTPARASSSSGPSQPMSLSISMPEPSHQPRSPYSYSPTQSTSTVAIGASGSMHSVTSTSPLLSPRSPSPAPPLPTLPPPPSTADMPSRSIITTIIYGDSGGNGGMSFDTSSGIWSKTINLTWPKAKSQNLWAMGESARSEFAEVSFWVKVKVIVTSASHGTFTLDLEPRELTVVSTNDSDRRLALAKFAEQKEASERSKSKSKSPGRRRARESDGEGDSERDRDRASSDKESNGSGYKHRHRTAPQHEPPLPSMPVWVPSASPAPETSPTTSTPSNTITSPSTSMFSSRISTETHRSSTGMSMKKPPRTSTSSRSSRRPHTSAGPRDKSTLAYRDSNESTGRPAMLTQNVVVVESSSPSVGSGGGPVRNTTHHHGGNAHHGPGSPYAHALAHDHEKEKEDLIRAWEDELKRIENVSRRSSAGMLAFFGGAGRKLRGRLGAGQRDRKVGVTAT